MKAILVDEATQQLYIGETDKPAIGENELLIKVKATALNRADLLQKRGLYPPPKGASPILGLEMSGVVEEVGTNCTNWKKGDRVCALLPGGGYAEYVAIHRDMAIPIPNNLSFEEATAIPEVFLTAYLNLIWLGKLQKEDTVLIHAGASGVGTAAIQLARHFGARVITTAGSAEKRKLCLKLGADIAIDYKAGPFLSQVKEATDGKGVQLILDFIGAPYWEQNINALATDGKLIIVGVMGGSKVNNIHLGTILFKRIQVIGTALRSQPLEKKIALTKEFCETIYPYFESGKIQPIIDSIWNWEEVNEAHLHMEKNKNAGKVILKINT